MKNQADWRPTKFIQHDGKLRASRDPAYLPRCSRFVADVVAPHCDEIIRQHARGRLLDLGCGRVPFYEVYRPLVSESVCVDWAGTYHKNAHVDLECDLTQPMPLPSASFDTVLMTDVLEHLPEPASAMREIARVLRAGGCLILGVPFLYWLHEEPHDYYRYTEFALRRFCRESGLEVLSLRPYGGLPEVFFDLTAKAGTFMPRKLAGAFLRLHGAAALLCRTALMRKISRATQGTFPLGYILAARKVECAC